MEATKKIEDASGQLLKATEVAKFLVVSKSFVYQLMQNGDIQSIMLGSSLRVRPIDLQDFINENLRVFAPK